MFIRPAKDWLQPFFQIRQQIKPSIFEQESKTAAPEQQIIQMHNGLTRGLPAKLGPASMSPWDRLQILRATVCFRSANDLSRIAAIEPSQPMRHLFACERSNAWIGNTENRRFLVDFVLWQLFANLFENIKSNQAESRQLSPTDGHHTPIFPDGMVTTLF